MNQVFLSGYLAQDGRLVGGGNGQACMIRVAVHSRYKDKEGKWQTFTQFIDVFQFGNGAQWTAQKALKGEFVVVTGRVAQSKQQGKGIYLRADSVEIISRAKEAAATPSGDNETLEEVIPF